MDINLLNDGDTCVTIDDAGHIHTTGIKINKIMEIKSDIETKVEEEKEMKILNIYMDKMLVKIDREYREKREEILKSDEIKNKVENFRKELEKEYKIYAGINLDIANKTEETLKLINELEEETAKKEKELKEKIREVEVQLEITETYEQKIDVLVNYEILDKKTKRLII